TRYSARSREPRRTSSLPSPARININGASHWRVISALPGCHGPRRVPRTKAQPAPCHRPRRFALLPSHGRRIATWLHLSRWTRSGRTAGIAEVLGRFIRRRLDLTYIDRWIIIALYLGLAPHAVLLRSIDAPLRYPRARLMTRTEMADPRDGVSLSWSMDDG